MVGTWTFAKLQKTWICSSRGLAVIIGVNLGYRWLICLASTPARE
ncbi:MULTISPECIES: hypothetical protein [Nostocales]|nr:MULTISPECIES: hypothetical protein [Nostocales]AFW94503.1 hypothetical protein ANA_C11742 [Anabaena sp. 90]